MQFSPRRIAAPFPAVAGGPPPGVYNWLNRRSIVIAALAIFSLQATVLLWQESSPSSSLFSNLAQVLLGVLSALAMLQAGYRSGPFARRIWFHGALAIAIYSIGQAILTYGMATPRKVAEPHITDVFFFFWMLPLLAAAVADRLDVPDGFDWAAVLDFIQLVLLAIALHLFVFGDASQWQNHPQAMGFLKWKVRLLRDSVVLAGLLGRAFISRSRQLRILFIRLGMFYLAYTAADAVYLYNEASRQVQPGTSLWDLCWSLPRLAAVLLAASWNHPERESERQNAPNWRHRCMLLYWVPMVGPSVMLALGARDRSWPRLSWGALIVASFGVASLRLLVTQLRQERALMESRASHNMLHSVIEGISDAIFLKDTEGRYRLINSAAAGHLGLRPEEVLGKTDADLFPTGTLESLRRNDLEVRRSRRPVTVEQTFPIRGKARTFLITKNPYHDASRGLDGVLGIALDVTERRAMEELLRRAQRMESIGTFSGGIAHDFNNLLTVIKGYSQIALSDPALNNSQLRTHIEQIDRASGRAASLIGQLLAFSRQQVLNPRVINLNQVILQLEGMLVRLIGEDVEIELHLGEGLDPVKADPGQIEQILMNLAANARDAMPAGGRITLRTANVHLRESLLESSFMVPAADYVLLMVSDTGEGMDAQTQTRIFEPFFTTKPQGKGTGLGLATVYGIVKQSAGYIAVDSYPGVGTSFRIYLPRVNEPVQAVRHATPQAVPRGAGQAVLVVDDDDQVRRLAATILSGAGYEVLQAACPEEAGRIAASYKRPVHLVLTDVVMAGGGGREAARKVRAVQRKARVLFMSGHSNDTVAGQGALENNAAFLAKPFSPGLLLERVADVLAAKSGKPELERV
jgi:PAS domain S-box-containing protein